MKKSSEIKDTKKVGLIGTGIMGKPIALNFIKSGYDVLVYNRTKSRADEIINAGAEFVDCPKELALRADIIITVLLNDQVVTNIVLGNGGVIEGIQPGSLLVDMTTVSPNTSRNLYEQLRDKQADFLEAPLIRGPRGAKEGTLMILVSGDENVFIKYKDLFQVIGKDIYYLGPPGIATTAKVIHNFISHVNLAVICEALALAKKAGLQLDLFFEILGKGAANSYVLQDRGPGIINRTFDIKAMVEIAYKDLGLVLELSAEHKALTIFPAIVRQLHQIAIGMGLKDKDASNLFKVFEKIDGIV